ncbi:MAG: CinA family protein [Brevirhabdus sp.]
MSAAALLAICRDKGLSVACAESCTGGMVAAALTDMAGSSAMFDSGVVTYSNTAKQQLLGVSAETLEQFGAVSQEVATEMVHGILARSSADLAVSVTGIAGPGGSEHKPEGRVCFAVALRDGKPASETVEFGAPGRSSVRLAARDHAIGLLLKAARA